MSDDRTPDELGVSTTAKVVAASPAGAAEPVAQPPDAGRADAGRAAEATCQKVDWLAPTTELPAARPPAPAEAGRDRLRRWGREYGGYAAAGVLAIVVLVCAVAGVPGVDVTWHAGTPGAAGLMSPTAPRSPTAQRSSSPAGPTSTPKSHKPARRPATAPKPLTSPRPPSPTPDLKLLGPTDSWAVAGLVDDYCERRFDRSATLLRPWRGSGAKDNWACRRRHRGDVIMADMTDACVLHYGKGAVASYRDAKDPFSWRCYRR